MYTRKKYMKAAVLEEVGKLVIKKVPIPRLREEDSEQVILQMSKGKGAAGICGTDCLQFNGLAKVLMPRRPGHEIAGTVVAIGSILQEPKSVRRIDGGMQKNNLELGGRNQ